MTTPDRTDRDGLREILATIKIGDNAVLRHVIRRGLASLGWVHPGRGAEDMIDAIYARLMPLLKLRPVEQFDIATKLAENVGYVLVPDAYAASPKPAPDAIQRILCGIVGTPDANGMVTFKVHESVVRQMQAAGETAPDALREALDDRQRVVIEWGERCFGADHMRDKIVRAARFFEEAAELVQAVGLPRDHAMRAFDHVYSRPAGNPMQEAGGAANTLMALCGALDLSFDGCQQVEIARCLAKDPSHFAKRNEAKLREVDGLPLQSTGDQPMPQVSGNDISTLWKAIADHKHGDLFWIVEILLNEITKETGYSGPSTPAIDATSPPPQNGQTK